MLARWSTLRVASTLSLLRRVLAGMLTQTARAKDARQQATLRLRAFSSSMHPQLYAGVFAAWVRVVRCAAPAGTAAARNVLHKYRQDDKIQTLVHEAALSAAKAKLVAWVPAEPHVFRQYPATACPETQAHAQQALAVKAQEHAEVAGCTPADARKRQDAGRLLAHLLKDQAPVVNSDFAPQAKYEAMARNEDVAITSGLNESQDLGAAGEEGELSMCEGWSRASLNDSSVEQDQESHMRLYPVQSPSSGLWGARQAVCRTSRDMTFIETSPCYHQKDVDQDPDDCDSDCDLDEPRSVLPEAHRQECLRASSLHSLAFPLSNSTQHDTRTHGQEEKAPLPEPGISAVPATPPQRPRISGTPRSPPSGVSSAASKASTVHRLRSVARGDGTASHDDDGQLLADLQVLMRQCAKDLEGMHTPVGRAPPTASSAESLPDLQFRLPSAGGSCPSFSGAAKVAALEPVATQPSVYVEKRAAGAQVIQQLVIEKGWAVEGAPRLSSAASRMAAEVLWLADESELEAMCAQSQGCDKGARVAAPEPLSAAALPTAANSSGAWQLVNQIHGLRALTSLSGMLATLRAHQRWGKEGVRGADGTQKHDSRTMMNPFTRKVQQDYLPQTLSLTEFLQLQASDHFLTRPLIVKHESTAKESVASRVLADGAETLTYLTQIAPELMRASVPGPLSPQQAESEEDPKGMPPLLIQRFVSNPFLIHGSLRPSVRVGDKRTQAFCLSAFSPSPHRPSPPLRSLSLLCFCCFSHHWALKAVGYSIAGTSSTCAPTYLWREPIHSCASTTMAMRSCNRAGIHLLAQEQSRRRLLPVGRQLESTSCGVLTRCVLVRIFWRCR